jgi:hypothetical protein
MRVGRRQRVSLTDKELWTAIHGMALGGAIPARLCTTR